MATSHRSPPSTNAAPQIESTFTQSFTPAAHEIYIPLDDPTYSDRSPSTCAGCSKSRDQGDKLLLNKECQKTHWKQHKPACDAVHKQTAPGAPPNLVALRKLAIVDFNLRTTTHITTCQGVLLKPWVATQNPAVLENIHCAYAAVEVVPKACYELDHSNVWNVGLAQAVGFPLLMMRVREKIVELDKHLPDQYREGRKLQRSIGGLVKENDHITNILAAFLSMDINPGSATFGEIPTPYPKGDSGLFYKVVPLNLRASAKGPPLSPDQSMEKHIWFNSPKFFVKTLNINKARGLSGEDPFMARLTNLQCPVDLESLGFDAEKCVHVPPTIKWREALAEDLVERLPFLWDEMLYMPDKRIFKQYHQ
ncbi:hypothetical protein LTR78_002728 [Recurvomyces mirabilis]|uniref:MYND-type domain-containing protein n=1 Tax=Recurvomyces mirabilis TaxID=574656 RepID=A0AAE0WSD1_9PEZI|nr:hypothetical protein LTR78_002728 [Recurvomyces mirabilis]KAK5159537.1 hypothetical protein LTS14_002679 [Recurvomyces mirabilis]